jgi:hypothetical protein
MLPSCRGGLEDRELQPQTWLVFVENINTVLSCFCIQFEPLNAAITQELAEA